MLKYNNNNNNHLLRRVKIGIRGHSQGRERFSAWREAPARQYYRKRARSAVQGINNLRTQRHPSMAESEQIAGKLMILMNYHWSWPLRL